ncbi:1555_t:CDS:2 [Funneliformis mosseae]|uniref:1555_t:CDS:1 n=1 Tax=Funneliformis mosseae TaxID=27381 RepID=A0A9N9EYZ3_FUNMO|nr:1555_t:CDS:2 [Funneliformis mosseae]
MSTIILFTYGLGTYEELMKTYNFDEAIRPNLLIGFGTQFKLIHSGFGEIALGVIPRRFIKPKKRKSMQIYNLKNLVNMVKCPGGPRSYTSKRRTA